MQSHTDWWLYVETELAERGWTPAEFSRRSGVEKSRLVRWRDDGVLPTPDLARRAAEAFGHPVSRAYVAAGILRPEEVGQVIEQPVQLATIHTDVLLAEFRRRLRDFGNAVDIPTDEDIAAHPERYSEGRITLTGRQRTRRGTAGDTPAG